MQKVKENILLKSVTVLVLATNKGWRRTNNADGCRVDEDGDGDEDAIALCVTILFGFNITSEDLDQLNIADGCRADEDRDEYAIAFNDLGHSDL